MRRLKHQVEYIMAVVLLTAFRILPFRISSALGATLGAFVATLPIKSNDVARKNVKKAFPEMTSAQVHTIQFKSAVNFGRTLAEMPKLYAMNRKAFEEHTRVDGLEHLVEHPGALILTAHLGNWEAILKACGVYGISVANIYRRANNKKVNKLIHAMRSSTGAVQIPKGRAGTKKLVQAVKNGVSIGFLNDQKLNEGIKSPFFGHDVMTPSALAEISIKHKKPVIPAFCYREGSGKFHIVIQKPLTVPEDVQKATDLFNQTIENAVKKSPEQWFWFHRRFG